MLGAGADAAGELVGPPTSPISGGIFALALRDVSEEDVYDWVESFVENEDVAWQMEHPEWEMGTDLEEMLDAMKESTAAAALHWRLFNDLPQLDEAWYIVLIASGAGGAVALDRMLEASAQELDQ